MSSYRATVAAVLVSAVACGTTEPAPTFLDVSGKFTGSSFTIQAGRRVDQALSLMLTQQAGTLTGTYTALGITHDGELPVLIDIEGSFTGTVGSGDNPLVGLVFQRPNCPGYQAHFGGHYNGTDSVLAISGTFDFIEGTCVIDKAFSMTFLMTRPPSASATISRP